MVNHTQGTEKLSWQLQSCSGQTGKNGLCNETNQSFQYGQRSQHGRCNGSQTNQSRQSGQSIHTRQSGQSIHTRQSGQSIHTRQSGQSTVEMILILVVLLGIATLISTTFKEKQLFAKIVEAPWSRMSGMIQNGVWVESRKSFASHPLARDRIISQKGDPLK